MTIQTPPLTAEQYVRIAVLDTLGAPVGDGELEMWSRIADWVKTGEVPAHGDGWAQASIKNCKGCGAACYPEETCGQRSGSADLEAPAEPEVEPQPKPEAEPALLADDDPEALKRRWLAENEVSTSVYLGQYQAMVDFLRRDCCMFVARMPPGTKGRAQWRYGDGTVDTAKLYHMGNVERKRRGLDPIPMPKRARA